MLHLLALLLHFSGRWQICSMKIVGICLKQKLIIHFGDSAKKDTIFSRKSSEIGLKNGPDSAKLSHERTLNN